MQKEKAIQIVQLAAMDNELGESWETDSLLANIKQIAATIQHLAFCWTPVSITLPPERKVVLVAIQLPTVGNHRSISLAYLRDERWIEVGCGRERELSSSRGYHVTHWMAIPELP